MLRVKQAEVVGVRIGSEETSQISLVSSRARNSEVSKFNTFIASVMTSVLTDDELVEAGVKLLCFALSNENWKLEKLE